MRARLMASVGRAACGLVVGFTASLAVAHAGPIAAHGYGIEIVREPGAIFDGLSRDGDALIVTDLAEGRLYRYMPGGTFTAFGPTFPHGVDVMGDPTGPYKAVRYGARYLIAEGWTPANNDKSPHDHALLALDEKSNVQIVNSDFWNPYDFVVEGDLCFVVDAARNSIERLHADGRGKTTVFTFARLRQEAGVLKPLSPTEFSKKQVYEFDAVPTGIAAHNGRLYVSLFAGFPFLPGSGRVVSLPSVGEATSARIEAVNLNAPVDVAFDTDGSMLVLEHGMFDSSGAWINGSGRLLRLDRASGKRQVILGGLTRPTGILVFDARQIVVSQLDGSLIFLKRKAN
jgi:hypothetical protein